MAAYLIPDRAIVIPGGFGCCGHPESITKAIERRYRQTGKPKDITLLFAAGPGDRKSKGINRLAIPGLVKKAVGGFWGFIPELGRSAMKGEIEAHNWPQGVISKLFRSIASGDEGLISPIGLGTFVDPRQEGGVINKSTEPAVKLVDFMGREKLFYPACKVNFAYIRATTADESGNLTMEEEVSLQDSLAQAQAAHNSGGIVVAQVKRVVKKGELDPLMVKVPGSLVDYIVTAENEEDHNQTYEQDFNPKYTSSGFPRYKDDKESINDVRKLIARRAAAELYDPNVSRMPIVNLGIGIPAEIGQFIKGMEDVSPTLTIEGGAFGGKPAYDLSFGASEFPDAIIDQNSLFDLYDGGGIDIAFLGFAQVDKSGNVNVSHYNGRLSGAGGFINISQSAKKVVFCGTFTTGGLKVDLWQGKLSIVREGRNRKFIDTVEQISFNGRMKGSKDRVVKFITERAVFELNSGKLKLCEIVDGIDIEKDIVSQIDFPLVVDDKVLINQY